MTIDETSGKLTATGFAQTLEFQLMACARQSTDEEECKKVPTWQTPLVSMSDDSDSSDENYFQTVYRRSSSAVNVSHSEDLMMDDKKNKKS